MLTSSFRKRRPRRLHPLDTHAMIEHFCHHTCLRGGISVCLLLRSYHI